MRGVIRLRHGVMGRRTRNRARARESDMSIPRDHMARVRVDEHTWREFRQAVGYKTITDRLGELVARDVAAHQRHRLRAGELHARAVLDALERACELARDLAAITERLERMRPAPPKDINKLGARPEGTAAHRPILGEDGDRPRGDSSGAYPDPLHRDQRPDRDA